MTRKSPVFHFAVPIVTRSVTAVTSTAVDLSDSGPAALPLRAVTPVTAAPVTPETTRSLAWSEAGSKASLKLTS